jgi:hypothetical protein
LTIPIHAFNNSPRRRTQFSIPLMGWTRSIGEDKQTTRLDPGDFRKDSSRDVRTIEDDESDWGLQHRDPDLGLGLVSGF